MTTDQMISDLSKAKVMNNNIQSLSDIEKTLSKKYTEAETISFNKLMFSIAIEARIKGVHTDSIIADMYVKSVKEKLKNKSK